MGNGGPATEALLESPQAVAADLSGTIYIADTGNGAIRRVSGGVISTVERFTGYIYDLKLDAGGDLYVAAGSNIFTVPPAGIVTKIAGNGSGTFSGDGGSATSAGLSAVEGIAIGNDGSIYLCDTYNNRVRKITADGIIHTIAGGNGAGFAGDNGPAAGALINVPTNIALDAIGNLYIRDSPATMPPPPAPPGTKVPLASRLTSRAK
jgi:sugar lactone lactonase YvrE